MTLRKICNYIKKILSTLKLRKKSNGKYEINKYKKIKDEISKFEYLLTLKKSFLCSDINRFDMRKFDKVVVITGLS